MHWKLKAHLLAVLSRTPGGRYIYRTLQRLARTDRTPPDEYVARAIEIVEMIRDAGRNPATGTYLEIGTGWKPYLPFLLSLLGADRIITLDQNPWLTADSVAMTFDALGERLLQVASRLGVDVSSMQERYEQARGHRSNREQLFGSLRIEYRYPADARRTELPDGSVDVVCSSNVLEHIPPDVLAGIHRESFRVLTPGGLAVHRFNPEDHFSTRDGPITAVNFLRYSEPQWRWYGGSGLAYHNRLRCRQHQELLEAAGFRVRASRVRMNERALEQIRAGAIPIHADFARFTPEELAADYMWLTAERPPQGRADESRAAL